MQFTWIPPEIALHILEHLSAKDVLSFCNVSRNCEKLGSIESLWRYQARRRWRGLLDSDEAPRGWKLPESRSVYRERLVSVLASLVLDETIFSTIYESTIKMLSFQERRLFMDAVARILCADGTVRSVFEPALLAELQPSSPLSVSMLRGSSLSTELFYSYSRLVGGKYIRRLLGPVLREVFADKSSLQLDPRHLPAGETKEENVERVRYYVDRIVHSLCAPKAVSTFPESLREIFHTLRKTTLACGHSVDLAHHLEVTFFFSKFVQSAIVKPELYDGSISLGYSVIDDGSEEGDTRIQEETRNRQKVCILAKIMGNVIQGVEFSDVEPEYQELNDLVTSNTARNKELTRQDWHATEASIRFLYRCLDSHGHRIRRALEQNDEDNRAGFAVRFEQLVSQTGKLLRAPSIVETISIPNGTNVRQRFDGNAAVLIDMPVAPEDSNDRAKRDKRIKNCFGSTNALLSGLPPMCSGCVLS